VTMRIYTAVLSEEIIEAGETLKEKLKLDFWLSTTNSFRLSAICAG
jgi:hypothetical protein